MEDRFEELAIKGARPRPVSYSLRAAGRLLFVPPCESAVRSAVASGELKTITIGQRRFVRANAIDKWLASKEV